MNNQYFIRSIQFVAVYELNKRIREKVFLYEKALKDHFRNPFKVVAISDEEDPNIPRFEAIESKSNLTVNQVRLSYTENFENLNDVSKLKQIISKRVSTLQPLLSSEKIQFVAYIAIVKYPFQDNSEIFNLFREKTEAKPASLKGLMEFSIFYAKPYKENYFLNINCARYEESSFEIKAGTKTLREIDKKFGIEIAVDINTRFRHNKKEPFYELLIEELENDLFDIVSKNNLDNYLSGGIE